MLSANLWIAAFVAAVVIECVRRLIRRSVSLIGRSALAQAVKARIFVALSILAVSLLIVETVQGFDTEEFFRANQRSAKPRQPSRPSLI